MPPSPPPWRSASQRVSRTAIIAAQTTIGLAKQLGITRWIGVGNKVDTDEARQTIEDL